jgi:hypothetical protein
MILLAYPQLTIFQFRLRQDNKTILKVAQLLAY